MGQYTSAWLYKLATYVCHSCESRNPEKPKKILDSRLIPAGMTDIELMQLSTSEKLVIFNSELITLNS